MTGRREQTKARIRAAIIEAGIVLMHEHGFSAVSTTQIARAAGVSPATLFNYFPTKASILFADDDLWAPPTEPPQTGATPRDTLCRLLVTVLDQPTWTKPVDDPLTVMRFELIRREPALADAQTTLAFAKVPRLAAIARAAHPDLGHNKSFALAGSLVGAVLAAITWTNESNLRAVIVAAIKDP